MTLYTSGLLFFILGCTVTNYGVSAATHNATRSASCTDKYAAIPDHTMCLAKRTQHPLTDTDRDMIVSLHDQIRKHVHPPAADMMKMYYSLLLEEEAQIWAENCKFHHDVSAHRAIPGMYRVGQNIAVTSSSGHSWQHMTNLWAADKTKYNFTYGAAHQKSSHYTQQIWASTSLIGCGVAHCSGLGYMYVCNYGPGGNIGDYSRPYKEATSGHAGEDCPHNKAAHSSLCDCNATVCYNRGVMDPDTCTCGCASGATYVDNQCSVSCEANSDYRLCGDRSPYIESYCTRYTNVPVSCPWMCGYCPYIGVNYVEGSVALPGTGNSVPVG